MAINASAASAAQPAPDLTIVTDARQLSGSEIRGADITKSDRGRKALAAAGETINVSRRAYRVYAFGDQRLVVDATTPVKVVTGLNGDGARVFQAIPQASAALVAARAGFAVPPSSAWKYNNDGSVVNTLGTWKRTIFWTLTKADNYKTSSTATAYDYWRVFGKMQAATITGAGANEGFKRAWLEFDVASAGTSPNEFELGTPEESYAGVANQTTTVGFGSTYSFNIGAPPLTAGGSANTSYGGSMTKSSENWHPVIRSEAGSGGVQWCRYEGAEFTGTKVFSTRQSLRVSSSSNAPVWNILYGQQDQTNSCPSQI